MLKKDCDREFNWYDRCERDKSHEKETKSRSIKKAIESIRASMQREREYQKLFNGDFGIDSAKSPVIMQLLQLFQADYLWIEIIDVETISPFCQSLKNSNVKHVILTDLSPEKGEYSNIVITEHFSENLVELLDKILECEPDTVWIEPAISSFEQTFYHANKLHNTEMIPKQISSFGLEISFYESYFYISFNTEKFSKSEMVPKIKKIFAS